MIQSPFKAEVEAHFGATDLFRFQGDRLILNLSGRRADFVAGVMATRQRELVREQDRLNFAVEVGLLDDLALALKPELLCLDIDGCLLDVSESFDAVDIELVRRYTGETASREEVLALRAEGGYNDDNDLAHEMIRRRGGSVTIEEVRVTFRDLYLGSDGKPGLYTHERPIIKAELLQRLSKDPGFALVTGRNREESVPALKLLNLPDSTAIWTVDDVVKGKPDPQGINEAREAAGVRHVWMVGDNVDDILAAKNAGAVPIGVGELGPKLAQAGAAIVLPDINAIEELL